MVMADNNVTFQSRPRFSIVGVQPAWIVQTMLASTNFNGKRATTAAVTNPDNLDPSVSRGRAQWVDLNNGGIFFLGGDQARPLVIEETYAKNCTATYSIVSTTDPALETTPVALRPWPSSGPIRLAKGECVRVTSTGATADKAEVGFLCRLEGQKIL